MFRIIVLMLVALFVMPLAGIWALNTLFALEIAMSVQTWAAMVALSFFLGSTKITHGV